MMKNKENKWWKPEIYMKNTANRLARARIISEIRAYFEEQDFQEVDTPALQVCPGMEVHLKAFTTELDSPLGESALVRHLHTSPELTMKKLLVAGLPKIYQLCHCYRNEAIGQTHLPEFTMLEWYRKDTTYKAMMTDTEQIVKRCAARCGVKTLRFKDFTCDPFAAWERLSVAEAFQKYAHIDIMATLDKDPALLPAVDALKAQAVQHGIWVSENDNWEDIFFRIMMEKIEPYLGHGRPTILYDYPTCLGALARRKPTDERLCERFEAYICGVELCNAFSELTDPSEQRKRFESDSNAKMRLYGYTYPIDEDFMQALEFGMPQASGNALGVDRLIMLITGAEDIQDTTWAPVL